MKKYLLIVWMLVCAPFWVFSQTEDCYIHLDDMSGLEISSYQTEIELAVCELVQALPQEFQNQFKVYDFGFYRLTEAFDGFDYPDAFETVINEVGGQSPYYILIGKESELNSLYTRFWVHIELPDITSNGCLPELNAIASNVVRLAIEKEYDRNARVPLTYIQSYKKGFEALKIFLTDAVSCCQQGMSIAQCLDCNNPDNIAANLAALGFVSEKISNITEKIIEDIPSIEDHAGLVFDAGELSEINISENYANQISIFQEQGLSIKIFITRDETICLSVWDSIKSISNGGYYDVVFWHHIHKGGIEKGDELLFSRVFIKGINTGDRLNMNRPVGPDPVSALIGALGSAFADAMIQATVIYLTDDNIKQGEWGEAFKKVNYGSVAWSGFVGLITINSKSILVATAVGSGVATVTYNAYQGLYSDSPNWASDMTRDFTGSFLGHIIGVSVGNAITNKLSKVNISYLSFKGFVKLAKILGLKIGTTRGIFFHVDQTFKPADEALGVLVNGSYMLNPTAINVNNLVKNPSGTIKFGSNYVHSPGALLNGKYMYVIDEFDNLIIGTRANNIQPFMGKAPHPTLLGGPNPKVQSAGIVEFRGGKIFKVDLESGHFKPSNNSLEVVKYFFREKFIQTSFHSSFVGFIPFNN